MMNWQSYAQLKPTESRAYQRDRISSPGLARTHVIVHQRNQRSTPPPSPGRLLLNATLETFCGCYSKGPPSRRRRLLPPQRSSTFPRSPLQQANFQNRSALHQVQPMERQRQLRRCSPLAKEFSKRQLPTLTENEPVTPLSPTTTLTHGRSTSLPLPPISHR